MKFSDDGGDLCASMLFMGMPGSCGEINFDMNCAPRDLDCMGFPNSHKFRKFVNSVECIYCAFARVIKFIFFRVSGKDVCLLTTPWQKKGVFTWNLRMNVHVAG